MERGGSGQLVSMGQSQWGSVSCQSEIFDPAAAPGPQSNSERGAEHKIGAFMLQNVPKEWQGYEGLQSMHIFLYDWAGS